jgi:hypothetical protein
VWFFKTNGNLYFLMVRLKVLSTYFLLKPFQYKVVHIYMSCASAYCLFFLYTICLPPRGRNKSTKSVINKSKESTQIYKVSLFSFNNKVVFIAWHTLSVDNKKPPPVSSVTLISCSRRESVSGFLTPFVFASAAGVFLRQ